MNEERIKRINELYHKSKIEGLTAEEKIEQTKLRQEYIAAIRADSQGTLNNISILNPSATCKTSKISLPYVIIRASFPNDKS